MALPFLSTEEEQIKREREKRDAAERLEQLKVREEESRRTQTVQKGKELVQEKVPQTEQERQQLVRESERIIQRRVEQPRLERAASRSVEAALQVADAIDNNTPDTPIGTSRTILQQIGTSFNAGDFSPADAIIQKAQQLEADRAIPRGSTQALTEGLKAMSREGVTRAVATPQGQASILALAGPSAPGAQRAATPVPGFTTPTPSSVQQLGVTAQGPVKEITADIAGRRFSDISPGALAQVGKQPVFVGRGSDVASIVPGQGIGTPPPVIREPPIVPPTKPALVRGLEMLAGGIEAIGTEASAVPGRIGEALGGAGQAVAGLPTTGEPGRPNVLGGTIPQLFPSPGEPPALGPTRGLLKQQLGEPTDDELALAAAVAQSTPGGPQDKLRAVVAAIQRRRQSAAGFQEAVTAQRATRRAPAETGPTRVSATFAPAPELLPTRARAGALLTRRGQEREREEERRRRQPTGIFGTSGTPLP